MLHDLGTDLNYNAYGEHESDLIALPAGLHALLRGHVDPLALDDDGTLARIHATRVADFALACEHPPFRVGVHAIGLRAARCRVEPAGPRRPRPRPRPAKHRVAASPCSPPTVTARYVVSVRAPLAHRHGADVLCRQFASGEGRAGAAGIDRLPEAQLDAFLSSLARAFAPDPRDGRARAC